MYESAKLRKRELIFLAAATMFHDTNNWPSDFRNAHRCAEDLWNMIEDATPPISSARTAPAGWRCVYHQRYVGAGEECLPCSIATGKVPAPSPGYLEFAQNAIADYLRRVQQVVEGK